MQPSWASSWRSSANRRKRQPGRIWCKREIRQADQEQCSSQSHLAVIVDTDDGPSPAWEEIASVSMVVQNMLLVGAAHNVGAYWSSESVVDGNVKLDENVALPANSIATAFNPAYASSKAAIAAARFVAESSEPLWLQFDYDLGPIPPKQVD